MANAEEFNRHIETLQRLERTYAQYLDASRRSDALGQERLRRELLRLSSPAQRAIDASGVSFAITPAPMFGGAVLTSLADQLFAFERPAYGPQAIRFVLDGLAAAEGALEDKRDNPEARLRAESHRRLTLFGHFSRLPGTIALLADVGTLTVLATGLVTKVAGLW